MSRRGGGASTTWPWQVGARVQVPMRHMAVAVAPMWLWQVGARVQQARPRNLMSTATVCALRLLAASVCSARQCLPLFRQPASRLCQAAWLLAVAAGWRLEGAALALKSSQQMSGYRGLFAGKVEERKERLAGARLPGGRVLTRRRAAERAHAVA